MTAFPRILYTPATASSPKKLRDYTSVPESLPVYLTSVFAFDDVPSVDAIYEHEAEGYARYLCFEGINRDAAIHYADKDVQLSLASYDYCKYSIRIEQIKAAYRILYSMLDKICFFMNDFWQLGLSQDKVNARRICTDQFRVAQNVSIEGQYILFRVKERFVLYAR